MAGDKLSAREAALIAQARAQLGQKPADRAVAQAPAARTEPKPAAAAQPAAARATAHTAGADLKPVAPESAAAAPALDPAERVAALMAAARAETERLRRRQRQLYLWAPIALMCVFGLWALISAWL